MQVPQDTVAAGIVLYELTEVDLHQEQALGAESKVRMLQVVHRSNQESGGDEQWQGERQLQRHQPAART